MQCKCLSPVTHRQWERQGQVSIHHVRHVTYTPARVRRKGKLAAHIEIPETEPVMAGSIFGLPRREKSRGMICIGKCQDCFLSILSKNSATLAPSGNKKPIFITSPPPVSIEKWKANTATANIFSHIYWNLLTPRLFLLAKCTMPISECKFYCL